jgi:hypothetical protein
MITLLDGPAMFEGGDQCQRMKPDTLGRRQAEAVFDEIHVESSPPGGLPGGFGRRNG